MPADLLNNSLLGENILPKTYNNLYSAICNFDNIYTAYINVCKNKRYHPEKLKFENNLEENLLLIQRLLIYKLWQPDNLKEFWVYDPKMRLIAAPSFRDRIVHHSLVQVIEPLFENKFIYDSYACRKGKGTHAAVNRVLYYLRKTRNSYDSFYVLKCDISKYFYNINHNKLISIIKRTIRCQDTLWLIDKIIKGNKYIDISIPIGALTSQLFANIYLNELDHYIKDVLSIKCYIRYMDDFIIIHNDKEYLWYIFNLINNFIEDNLLLKLNNKSCLFKYIQGIDFCGYRIWPTHILPRKRNVYKIKRKLIKMSKLYYLNKCDLNAIKPIVMSFLGYMDHCCNHITVEHILYNLVLTK